MNDHVLIATAYHSEVRIYVAYTKSLVEEARNIHHTWPTASAALGRLLTAGAMMSFMYKDNTQISLKVSGDGPIGAMSVESNTLGEIRADIKDPSVYLIHNDTHKLAVGQAVGNGYLTVLRKQPYKMPYTSTIDLRTGEIGDDLTYYFAVSEQTPSSVGLGVLVDPDQSIKQAGGFIIQLLPGASEETIVKIENVLSKISSVTDMFEEGLTTHAILDKLSSGDFKLLSSSSIYYHCGCTKTLFGESIAKLDDQVLDTLINEDEGAEIVCHYCKKGYNFTKQELIDIKMNKR